MHDRQQTPSIHLLIGDGHFVGDAHEAPRLADLVDRSLAAGITEVSILGDLFELWIALDGCAPPGLHTVVAHLRRWQTAGVRLRYVCGNKDYFVGQWNKQAKLFDAVVDEQCVLPVTYRQRAAETTVSGHLVLAHGDLVNTADKQYRLWRWFSRSPPVALAMRCLPRRWLSWLSDKTAAAMVGSNRRHKSYFPDTRLHEHARRQVGTSTPPTTFVFGHFHEHHDIETDDYRIITLPFLGGEYAGVLLQDGAFRRF